MNKKLTPTFDDLFEEIQKPESYKSIILELRKKSELHTFVEWVLSHTIKQRFGGKFSIQPEKYGVSNGRIDMALYHTPRTIIHFELITTFKNDHVFRDTTSLLASRADEKLAILIDEDLEAGVAKNFFKAIPDSQIKFIFLREIMLNKQREKFMALVDDLVGSAEFKNGSTNPESFYCSIQGREIEIFKKLLIEYHNAPIDETLTLQLQQHESKFIAEHLTSIKIKNPEGSVDIAIPYVDNTPGESYYLAAYLSSGERWRKLVYVQKSAAAPVAFVTPGKYSPMSDVSFSVQNFPPRSKLRTSIFQENHGQGCNHGQEVITTDNGSANGIFTVPHFIGVERIKTGEYGLEVSTIDSPFRVRTRTTVNILAAEVSTQLWRPIAVMTNNHFASVALRGLGYQKDQIEIEYELINLNSEPLTFNGISVLVRNKEGIFLNLFVGSFSNPTVLQPSHKPLVQRDRFVRLATPDDTTTEQASVLEVSWSFTFGASRENLGQMFSLAITDSLRDDESEALFG